MSSVQISARIDRALEEAIDHYCKACGAMMNCFIQEALLDKLEEQEDIEDLTKIRHEPRLPVESDIAFDQVKHEDSEAILVLVGGTRAGVSAPQRERACRREGLPAERALGSLRSAAGSRCW